MCLLALSSRVQLDVKLDAHRDVVWFHSSSTDSRRIIFKHTHTHTSVSIRSSRFSASSTSADRANEVTGGLYQKISQLMQSEVAARVWLFSWLIISMTRSVSRLTRRRRRRQRVVFFSSPFAARFADNFFSLARRLIQISAPSVAQIWAPRSSAACRKRDGDTRDAFSSPCRKDL